jgi:7-carboxy-7-deazaguanine synthase
VITTNLIEVYCSIQGEGPHVGGSMVFVRFQDCALHCSYCDTPASFKKHPSFRYEAEAFSGRFSFRPNPVSAEELTQILKLYDLSVLSLTGGEPLQQVDFLAAWLPKLKGSCRILLETNGVLPEALAQVISYVDIVSMDFKLPSVTGMRAYWEEHERFLSIARQKEVYVKVVVSTPTETAELEHALDIVQAIAPGIPFILQPVTPAYQVKEGIPETRLNQLYDLSRKRLADVRVIPQVHQVLGLL